MWYLRSFPNFCHYNVSDHKISSEKIKKFKRNFNKINKDFFRNDLLTADWSQIDDNPNVNYNNFINKFSQLYDKNFPIKESFIKIKDVNSPWITKGLKKTSKFKQKLYIKFLKNKNPITEMNTLISRIKIFLKK